MKISIADARRLALAAGSGLHPPTTKGVAAVSEVVARLGFVQIDTISVVERAHHHILGARVPGYRPEWLNKAEVFEYWAHAASYLPWCDYRYTLPRKLRILDHGHDWFRVEPADTEAVLARIRDEGPLRSADFENVKGRAGWWDWKPSKRALEFLFMSGQLMTLPRQGFQKVFDLTARVLPAGLDVRVPEPDEMAEHYLDRALDVWGLVARDELAYQRREHREGLTPLLKRREAEGRLVRLEIEGIEPPYWTRPESLERLGSAEKASSTMHLLSPFDPLVIHRKRLLRLFGYDLKLECYVPAPKRTFGYFGLPILWKSSIAGLVDLKLERKTGELHVRNLRHDGPPGQKKAFDTAVPKALESYRKRLISRA